MPRIQSTPSASRHAEVRKRSYELLAAARAEASKRRRYNSESARRSMSEECAKRMGFTPRTEQLDLAECMLLGLDAVCIAGTGWGKTLPFVLPLLVPQSKRKIILVISPLNALEFDQAARFERMNINAIALNGATCTSQVLKDIERGSYSVVVTGPKLLVGQDNPVRALFNNARFTRRILGFIVDEAHCISQWGGDFRREYAELDVIRALIPPSASVQLTSATLPPLVLAEAMKILRVQPEKVFLLNLGNDRRNITWEVRSMAGGKTDYEALAFLIPGEEEDLSRLPKTMVFFDDILVLMKARRWLLSKLPRALHARVKEYHSRWSELAKLLVMEGFVHGTIDIVFATEAAGMGCDIADITLVVQFMAPESLPVWIQRAGRAGRRPDLQARAILLIQKSVYMEKGKKKRRDDEPVEYVKEINNDLRTYASAPPAKCRRDVADEYFDNPPGREAPTGECCDNCTARRLAAEADAVPLPQSATPPTIPIDPQLLTMEAQDPAEADPADRFALDRWHEFLPVTRSDKDMATVKTRLIEWRRAVWKTHYRHQPFGSVAILPDHVLSVLSSKTTFRTIDHFGDLKWLLWKRHSQEVLQILDDVDKPRALENLKAARAKQAKVDLAKAEREREKLEHEVERLRKQADAAQRRQEREEQRTRKAREQEEKRRMQEEKRRVQEEKRQAQESGRTARVSSSRTGKRKADAVPQQAQVKRRRAGKENESAVGPSNSAVNASPQYPLAIP
ncbi:P-loop containing nucleoside triphosphate hydrolase protein [Trametes polyzona]|nr:P-loop containing nucleoside triphosphate hydrolase protein [Trametes polyzona]